MATAPPFWVQRLFWSVHSLTWDAGVEPSAIARAGRWAGAHAPRGSAILDLGCGTGTATLALAAEGFSVTGVDFAAGMLRRAREKARRAGLDARFHRADLNAGLPFADASFDGALSVNVLHCLAEPSAHLREVRRVLRTDGTLCLGVKAVPGEGAPGGGRRTWFTPIKRMASRAAHLHGFTRAGLHEAMLAAALVPVWEEDGGGWLWVTARASSLAPPPPGGRPADRAARGDAP